MSTSARRFSEKFNYFRIIRIKTTPTKYITGGKENRLLFKGHLVWRRAVLWTSAHRHRHKGHTPLGSSAAPAGEQAEGRERDQGRRSNNEQQGTHTTGPLSPLFATTIKILPRWDVRVEEVGEGAREPSGWKTCMCGRLREWGTWPRRNL